MNQTQPTYPVGKRIRHFREKNKLTVNKLANLAGVSQSYLRSIEMDEQNPTIEFISILCSALNITIQEFFIDSPETLSEDPLIKRISLMSQEQRDALLSFLEKI